LATAAYWATAAWRPGGYDDGGGGSWEAAVGNGGLLGNGGFRVTTIAAVPRGVDILENWTLSVLHWVFLAEFLFSPETAS